MQNPNNTLTSTAIIGGVSRPDPLPDGPALDFDNWRAFSGGPPGSKRSPCLGCGQRVQSARDPHVQIAGTRDGSWLAMLGARPGLIPVTDPGRIPDKGVFLLGFAHRGCIDEARARLTAGQARLPDDLREVVVEGATDDPPENLDLPPRPDQCPFCEGSGRLSDEHVWPAWMIQEFRRLNNGAPFTFGQGDEPARLTRRPDLTVPVCEHCNNRWLSVQENDVKAVLRPIVLGTDCDLTPSAQALLATWAVKTALMINLLDPASAFIPLGRYREFGQERRALSSTVVWIGGYVGMRFVAWTSQSPLYLGDPRPELPNAFVTTFTAFRVVFQVLGYFTKGGATLTDGRPASLALHRIWPPRRETLRWPRAGLAFADESLAELAASFDHGADKGLMDPPSERT